MIIIKNDTEIEYMRQAGKLVGETLNMLQEAVKPGVTTAELDKLAEDFITKHNAIPSFKGYGGFPASICTSVNEEVIHGIPSKNKILHEGDILSVDCGAILNGYQGDAARTFPVGKISEEAAKLIKVTKESFFKGTSINNAQSILSFLLSINLSSASACLTVLGKPSNKNPLLQSSLDILSFTISIVNSSGTRRPLSIYPFAFIPSSVFSLILALNISPVDMCGIENSLLINLA